MPSAENVTARTQPECALTVRINLPLGISQNFIVLSLLPLTKMLPSGEKAMPPIQFSKACAHPSCSATQKPRRSTLPSNGSDLCPSNLQISCPLGSTSNSVMPPTSLPLAKSRPS